MRHRILFILFITLGLIGFFSLLLSVKKAKLHGPPGKSVLFWLFLCCAFFVYAICISTLFHIKSLQWSPKPDTDILTLQCLCPRYRELDHPGTTVSTHHTFCFVLAIKKRKKYKQFSLSFDRVLFLRPWPFSHSLRFCTSVRSLQFVGMLRL